MAPQPLNKPTLSCYAECLYGECRGAIKTSSMAYLIDFPFVEIDLFEFVLEQVLRRRETLLRLLRLGRAVLLLFLLLLGQVFLDLLGRRGQHPYYFAVAPLTFNV